MAPTLAELRAQNGPKPLPKAEQTVTLVEGQHLSAAAKRLNDERTDLAIADRRTDDEGQPVGPPAKVGQGGAAARERQARMDAIAEELSVIVESLGDFQAEVGLVGMSGGDWQRFKDAHPPREDNMADIRLTNAHCNASDLFAALGSYVKTWNGEPVTEDDWDTWLAERVTYADRRDMVTAVVMMHEQGFARAPKSQSSSSSMEPSAND